MDMHVTAILLAAGSSSRMNLDITKQRLRIGQGTESVLKRCVRVFNECEDIDSVIIVTRSDELEFATSETADFKKVSAITVGGKTRAESARAGFLLAYGKTDMVAIHDVARCFINKNMISAVVNDAKKYGAATASMRVVDTVKKTDPSGFITSTVNREELRLVQTPQVFSADLYKKALDFSDVGDVTVTDDNILLERIGVYPYCTDTGKTNLKLTTQDDLPFANFLISGEDNA